MSEVVIADAAAILAAAAVVLATAASLGQCDVARGAALDLAAIARASRGVWFRRHSR